MRKNIYTIALFLIFYSSCSTKLEQTPNKNNIISGDIIKMKQDIDSLNNKISTLEKKLKILIEEKVSNSSTNNSLSESYFNNVIIANISKSTLTKVTQANHHFHLSDQNDIMRTLTNNLNELKELGWLSNSVRSRDYINNFFTEDVINMIVYILYKNNTYETSRTNIYVNSLIETYDTISEDDYQLLERLYDLASIGYHEKSDEIENLLIELNDLDEDIFETQFNDYVTGMSGKFNLYSFWARRHKENNKEAVYKVLKKIQVKMNKK